jgi:hypothetical protein
MPVRQRQEIQEMLRRPTLKLPGADITAAETPPRRERVEQKPLYDQYRMDQPWNSDNNKQVLARMPAVFCDPTKPETSYNALFGPATALGPKDGKGTKFQEITDGPRGRKRSNMLSHRWATSHGAPLLP